MRTFKQTHPWITFNLDIRRVEGGLWLLFGEAVSKCEHLAGVPLQPSTADRLHALYLAKGLQGTTAIEGNTLTEEEVLDRIEGRSSLPPSKEYLGKEIDNILLACNKIKDKLMRDENAFLNPDEISEFNKIILKNLDLGDPQVVPGKIRAYSVGVSNYRGAPFKDCEHLLNEMCKWLNSESFNPPDNKIMFGIMRAIIAHIYMAWIHPFGDGNGRVARLVEFKILLAVGIPTPAAHLLSNHYNATRTEYYRQLELSSKSGGDIIPFIEYAMQGFVDGLRDQIKVIQNQQLAVAWRDHIYEAFRKLKREKTEKSIRRRNLALDISDKFSPIPFNEIHEISPRVTELYRKRTSKTIRRDLHELTEMNLLIKTDEGYIANKAIMLSFLPERRDLVD